MIGLLIKVTGKQNSAPAALFMIAAYNMLLICILHVCIYFSTSASVYDSLMISDMDVEKRENSLYFQCLGTLL